jgi:hypothetical protein
MNREEFHLFGIGIGLLNSQGGRFACQTRPATGTVTLQFFLSAKEGVSTSSGTRYFFA